LTPIAPDPLVLAQSGITFGPSCFWNMEVVYPSPSEAVPYIL
jgi:hypothetical protein